VHRFGSLVAALILPFSERAVAQYAATQDASLRGFRQAALYVSVSAEDLAPDSAQALTERVKLELGEVGLVVVSDQSDRRLRPDGILRVVLTSSARGRWLDDLVVRVQVEQTSVLPRTGDALLMVTWYSEQSDLGVPATELAPHARVLVQRGIDRFIRAWLAANGR
jgi:hypothetical protein